MQPLSPLKSRILKSVAGLVILASVGWVLLERLFQVSSVEAAVNAEVVTLRAPIGGVVSASTAAMRVGAAVASGNMLLTVEDARADHAGIERALSDLRSANENLAATTARIDRLAHLRAATAARVEDYRGYRVRRVEADLAVGEAQIASAQAVVDRAAAEVARQSSLATDGVGARAALETAERDLAVARASLEQAKALALTPAVVSSPDLERSWCLLSTPPTRILHQGKRDELLKMTVRRRGPASAMRRHIGR